MFSDLSNNIFKTSGAVNLLYADLSIIKLAKYLDWPYVCIFEDDAYPCRDCVKHLQQYLNDVPDDASFVVLGWSYLHGKAKEFGDKKYVKLNGLWGTTAFIVFRDYYD